MATHSSVLAWRIPWTEEPGGLHTMEWSQRVVHDRSDLNHAHLEQSLLRPPQLSMRECAPRNVDVRGRKHHPQVVPWLNCACAELSCPPLITSPTPRAPHSTRLSLSHSPSAPFLRGSWSETCSVSPLGHLANTPPLCAADLSVSTF